jgi:L-cysteine:1D-myo-inositol 2-amino-2-deoxy-alpha-D-glucopyranoside ligase
MSRFSTAGNLASMDTWRRPDLPELPGQGPVPRLRDTATGELVPAALGSAASLYACGITPYDATHIGHAATYVAWDLLVRSLLDAGLSVVYVQNVTDVDDPLLERADRDGEDWRELAVRETDRYRGDMVALRVLPPDHLVGAVEALPIIERYNEVLASRGTLYDVDDDVYFARSSDSRFGALSGPGTVSGYGPAEMATLFAERGGDPARPGKKDPLDCLVWRAERPGEPAWASSFGPGRPGWHVECSAIAAEYLGERFDVQAGGSDLIFPHHEMSASHARVAFASLDAFARVYAHSGLVSYQGEKMSKSLGNLVFVSRLLATGTDPMVIRLALLGHHYRTCWEWTDTVLARAGSRLSRWRQALAASAAGAAAPAAGLAPAGAAGPGAGRLGAEVPGGDGGAWALLAEVRAAMADDLDAPRALAAIDRWADTVLADTGPAAAPSQAATPSRAATPSQAATPSRAVAPAGADLVRLVADALLGISLLRRPVASKATGGIKATGGLQILRRTPICNQISRLAPYGQFADRGTLPPGGIMTVGKGGFVSAPRQTSTEMAECWSLWHLAQH